MDVEKFFVDYRQEVLPIYADYVALTKVIPQQVLVEISNAFSHLSQYYNGKNSSEDKYGNLVKAHGHLVRISLDLHKMVWDEEGKLLKNWLGAGLFSALSFNLDSAELNKKYSDFLRLGAEARRHELENVGIAPEESIERYDKVCAIGAELIENIDKAKLHRLALVARFLTAKEFLSGLVLGVLSSLLAQWLWIHLAK